MQITGNKTRRTPTEVGTILHDNGWKREEIVLKVLRYTIDNKGILKNNKGMAVGSLNTQGYRKIQITFKGKKIMVFIHRIQAFKKYGKKLYEEGIQVRHLNDIKKDNSWENIAIGTAKDNYQDRGQKFIEKQQKLATQASIKYNKELIQQAKQYYEKTNNLKETAEKFNIPAPSLHYRLKGKKKQIR